MAKQTSARLKEILFGPHCGPDESVLSLESELTRLQHMAHFCVHVWESFVRNRCLVRASALSFSTLLALIPMLAVAIGVTSSFLKTQGEDQIYAEVNKFVSTMVPPATISERQNAQTPASPDLPSANNRSGELTSNETAATVTNLLAGTNQTAGAVGQAKVDTEVVSAQEEAARRIHEFVQNTSSAKLGIVGVLLLVWVAISMLANIEDTFNDIWGVARGRSWFWRFWLYWGVLTFGPLALVGAYSIGVIHTASARQAISQMPVIGNVVFEVLPLLILWMVFAGVYRAVPNTRVYWRSALVGGLVGGALWHLNNVLGYLFVSRFLTYHSIYGGLGLLPVFMVGLYFSWVILLFGVQVSYAWQNRWSYLQDKFAENVNQRGREFIALRLMTFLGMRYQMGQPPATVQQISCELGVSTRLTQKVMETLLAARLISEVAGAEASYCPARPLDAINAHQILLAVRSVSKPVVFTRQEPVRDEIYGEFARIEEAERVAAASVTMQVLVNRARAKLEPPAIDVAAKALTLPDAATVVMAAPEMEATAPVIVPAEMRAEAPLPVPEKPARRMAVPEDNQDFPL